MKFGYTWVSGVKSSKIEEPFDRFSGVLAAYFIDQSSNQISSGSSIEGSSYLSIVASHSGISVLIILNARLSITG